MRLSVDPDDPGYAPRAAVAAVFLNDMPVSNCVTADDETGEVLLYILNPDGSIMVIDGMAQLRWFKGKVEIVLPNQMN